MTLLAPPRAPVLARALEAVGRGDGGAGDALARAVAADEEVLVPTSADGRHPLMTGPTGEEHLTAFTGPWMALWGHPWRPPVDLRPVGEVLGWVRATGRLLRLDHASEADTRIDPATAEGLLAGRPVDAAALAAGAPFRNPGPVAPAPAEILAPAPEADGEDGEVTFARGWDPAARRPVEPVAATDLAGVAAGYAAVRLRGDRTDVLVFGETVVIGTTYAPGVVHRWEWARFDVGLFQTEAGTAVDDGSPRPHPHLVVLARPDGLLRTWRALVDGGEELVTSSTPDVSDRWIGVPPLGVFAPLVDPGA